ncbi:MAG: DEAD/DEAH box helicase [Candidatus Dasytiphilus stammeri]
MANLEKTFAVFELKKILFQALNYLGYQNPTPIQVQCIPYMLKGLDVLGIAQTGSGKTAAFALPILNKIDIKKKIPQCLILTPTRELAIQVSNFFANLALYMKGIIITAIYGGQRYEIQLRALYHGTHIIVGTPGRILDHIYRGTLNISQINILVLDEADEMLRMGFIEDVESIMSHTPQKKQIALFSATMPDTIRRITRKFMNNPLEIRLETNKNNAPDINQSYWVVQCYKAQALTYFLEAEDFEAAIIFVRTKNTTVEVAQYLERSGYKTAALNGDMTQPLRERTLEQFKKGQLDVLIATDVAARGLDVERISLVINYDIPLDVDSYIHRIGRTGRAGRTGKALLFVENRERRLLRNIERTLKISIPKVLLPSTQFISERRLAKFSAQINHEIESCDIELYRPLLKKIELKTTVDLSTVAVALLKIAQYSRPLILPNLKTSNSSHHYKFNNSNKNYLSQCSPLRKICRNNKMDLYRIEVGRNDGIEVRHIVGMFANQGYISSCYIGNIKLFPLYSTVELPTNMPSDLLGYFRNTKIFNKKLNMQLLSSYTRTKLVKFSKKRKKVKF